MKTVNNGIVKCQRWITGSILGAWLYKRGIVVVALGDNSYHINSCKHGHIVVHLYENGVVHARYYLDGAVRDHAANLGAAVRMIVETA